MWFRLQLKSIITKLIITNFVIMFFITGFVFYNALQSNIVRLKTNLQHEIKTDLSFIAQDLVKISVFDTIDIAADLTSRLSSFSKINHLVLYNLDKEGIFYYTKEGYPAEMNVLTNWKEHHFFSKTEYVNLSPLLYQETQYGYVSIIVSITEINEIIGEYKQQAYAFIFALFLVTFWIMFIFRSLVSKPIQKLIKALKKIESTGEFSSHLTVKSNDEIGKLFTGFNNMQDAIRHANKKLDYQRFALDEHAIVAITDVKGNIIFANNKFSEISGYQENELIGKNHRLIKSNYHPKSFFKGMYETIANGNVWHGVICNKSKYGRLYWVDTTITPFLSESGKPESYIAIRTDITKLKELQKEAEYLSHHDVLTGLPNRFQVEVHLNNVIDRAQRNNTKLALVFMDLNKFKFINDTFGHKAGDHVLKDVSRKFTQCLRKSDFVARHGGDEFVAIIEDVQNEINLSHLLNKIITEINKPIIFEEKPLYIGLSMGISMYPEDADSTKSMFAHADAAMYLAKEISDSNFQFYTQDLNKKVIDRYQLESDLKHGLAMNELFCVFQPKVNMSTKKVIGAEVLVRWRKDGKSFISPAEFIPIAESCGLINEIWGLVLDQSMAFANKLHKNNKSIPLAVNISPVQFSNTNLAQEIFDKLQHYSLPYSALAVEITESLLVGENTQAIEILNTLAKKKIGIAIDDFGTGYSSLKYLKTFPIDLVKLDISFISGIGLNKEDEQLVKTMIDMAHGLGINVIAEGVETEKQRDFLLKNGCEFAQGYLYSKPLNDSDFLTFIQDDQDKKIISLFEVKNNN